MDRETRCDVIVVCAGMIGAEPRFWTEGPDGTLHMEAKALAADVQEGFRMGR